MVSGEKRNPVSKDLTPEELELLKNEMLRAMTERPPSVGLIGVSGVGKSSTINAMFSTSLEISHTVACTKKFRAVDLALEVQSGETRGSEVRLRVIDAPGLGEDVAVDPSYLAMYDETLPSVDVILWILSARNRAMALDQGYLQRFLGYRYKIVFAINQVDLVPPMDWNERINLPSETMEANIAAISRDRAKRLASITRSRVKIIAYSAAHGYNLERLFAAIIEAIPADRRWMFGGLKGFSYQDFVPTLARDLSHGGEARHDE